MRMSLLFALGSIAVAAPAACASSEEQLEPPTPENDSGSPPLSDSGTADSALEEADAPVQRCSAAGWCTTPLPDPDLVFRDLWPFPQRAFAIAESPTIGVRVLEWREADGTWRYIDDRTQNQVGLGKFVGSIWAPNEDEVYFAIAPAFIYHGVRPAPPATEWTWTRQRLEDHNPAGEGHEAHDHGYPIFQPYGTPEIRYPALGVWGTGASDVYAWYGNAIYHWKSEDGGPPAWVTEYVADDRDPSDNVAFVEDLYIVSAGGSGPGDVWFSGARDRRWFTCPLAIRRTAAGYTRVADGVVKNNNADPCKERPGSLLVNGEAGGWLTDLQSSRAGELVGLKSTNDTFGTRRTIAAARIVEVEDRYEVSLSVVPVRFASAAPGAMTSLWQGPDAIWLSGFGLILQGDDVWDGGTYRVSTLAQNGAPLNRPIYRVRGTSNTNLWAIGVRNALHKTTP